MYKVIIADDEYYIKTGMREMICWSDYGFELAGEASDGEEALELAKAVLPDLIITDVRMPRMNGIELINSIKACLPESKIIIISGHSDFEYAQQAIKLSVCDYILKPVDKEELEKLIKRVKEELDARNENNEQIELLRKQLQASMPILRDNFLINWISNRIKNESEIISNVNFYNIGKVESFFLVITFCIDDLKKEQNNLINEEKAQLMRLLLMNTCKAVFDRECNGRNLVFADYDGKVVVLLHSINPGNADFYEKDIYNFCSEIRESVAAKINNTITVGIGKAYDRCNEIYLSYHESLEAIHDKFWLGKNQIIYYKDIHASESFDIIQSLDERKQILDLLRVGDTKKIGQAVKSFFEKANRLPLAYIKNICIEFVLAAMRTLMENNIRVEDVFGKNYSAYSELDKIETMEDVINYLISIFELNASHINKVRSTRKREVIYLAVDFIEKNYDSDFGLDAMCDHIKLSTHYFSSLFKQEMGENFLEYLTKFRVNKAKELMKNPLLKTYDIAEKVGYSDARYFSQLFKKYVGCTPSEYREKATGISSAQ